MSGDNALGLGNLCYIPIIFFNICTAEDRGKQVENLSIRNNLRDSQIRMS